MLARIKKFYKKYEKIQELKKKGLNVELIQQAGGDRIQKYKRKIGDEYRVLQKDIAKILESAPPSKAKSSKAPVIEHPISVMRTRKRDEKKESKAPTPPTPPAP